MSIVAADVLAGPIVRRVQKDLVTVWCALRKPAAVTLEVFDGESSRGSGTPLTAMARSAAAVAAQTVRVGDNLYVVLATFVPVTDLRPDRIYSYDLAFDETGAGVTATTPRLGSLGFLADGVYNGEGRLVDRNSPGATTKESLALGYATDARPTFTLPPSGLANLKVVHGSCRNPSSDGIDATPGIDDLIKKDRANPLARPHLLFLTGDQVYADEANPTLVRELMRIGGELLGGKEKVSVDVVPSPGAAPQTHEYAMTEANFPPGRRQRLMVRAAKFSSSGAEGHLIGLGEFAAMYLMVWSNTLWPDLGAILGQRWADVEAYGLAQKALLDELAVRKRTTGAGADHETLDTRAGKYHGARLLPAPLRELDRYLTADDRAEVWADGDGAWAGVWQGRPEAAPPSAAASVPTDDRMRGLARAMSPSWYAGAHHFAATTVVEGGVVRATSDDIRTRLHRLKAFADGLPRVRRALANVAVYMTFDDHEITDDWNITKAWVEGVNGTSLGRTVLRNGLVAYALFQAWGNDPRAFADGSKPQGALLADVRTMFFDGDVARASGPAPDMVRRLDARFRLVAATELPAVQRMDWHYQVTWPKLELLALDSRTRRAFKDRDGGSSVLADHDASALLDDAAVTEQIPSAPTTLGTDGISFVIAPAPFLGAVPFEHFGQPVVNLVDQTFKVPDPTQLFGDLEADYRPARLHHDPEPWGYAPALFETVLARLATDRRRVVFLSGDVHYSLTMAMSYWRLAAGSSATTRFIQLTSSALKNQQGPEKRLIFHLALVQQLGGHLTNTLERVAWRKNGEDPIDRSGVSFDSRLHTLLGEDPIVVPPRIVPAGTAVRRQPEWAWRMSDATDERADHERLPATPRLGDDVDKAGLALIATRHYWQLYNAPARRFIWDNNLCHISVEGDDTPDLVQAIYTMAVTPDGRSTEAQTFVRHKVALDVAPTETVPAIAPPP